MTFYLYRRGNGNDGNFARLVVVLKSTDSPFAALRALVANDYIPGKKVRRHIIKTIEVDGEAEHGVIATVYEGPDDETEFGAAYITAELEPLDDKGREHYRDQCLFSYPIREVLDRGALTLFRKHNKSEGAAA